MSQDRSLPERSKTAATAAMVDQVEPIESSIHSLHESYVLEVTGEHGHHVDCQYIMCIMYNIHGDMQFT